MDQSFKLFIWFLFFPLQLFAENFYLNDFCESKNLTLEVRNLTDDAVPVWIEILKGDVWEEHFFLTQARGTEMIRWSSLFDKARPARIKTTSSAVKMIAHCLYSNKPVHLELSSNNQTQLYFMIKNLSSTSPLIFNFINLFPGPQKVKIIQLDKDKNEIHQSEVFLEKYFENTPYSFVKAQKAHFVVVQAEARVSTTLLQEEKSTVAQINPFYVGNAFASKPIQSKRYFLVGQKYNQQDGFIIALDDTKLIDQFLEQLRRPELEKIIFANAVVSKKSYNRNINNPLSPPYSWEIQNVSTLGDFGPIGCDGSPDLFEDHILEKINQGASLCFWKFRVLRELAINEVFH